MKGLYIAAALAAFMLLISLADKWSEKSKTVLVDCKVFYAMNLVIALYYNNYSKQYCERIYTISLWPIKDFCPIKFDLYYNGIIVIDKELRKKVLKYIKNNPPCQ